MARTTYSYADLRISTVVLWCTSFARSDGFGMFDIRVPQVITTRSRTGVGHSADICLKHLWSASANMYGDGSAGPVQGTADPRQASHSVCRLLVHRGGVSPVSTCSM